MSVTEQLPATRERLLALRHRIQEYPLFANALAALQAGEGTIIEGAYGSSCALAIAAAEQVSPGPVVIVTSEVDGHDELLDALPLFTEARTQVFPAWETEPGERLVYDEIYGRRQAVLKSLAEGAAARILLTNIQALLQPTPTQALIAECTRMIRVGQRVNEEQLRRWLAERGFHGTTAIELPGEFSQRGGILDIFALDWLHPVRIEFFGDEVESIREFDCASQRSLGTLEEIHLTVLPRDCERSEHFTSFLPENAWFFLLDPVKIEDEGATYLTRVEKPLRFHSVREVMQKVMAHPYATFQEVAASTDDDQCRLPVDSVERFSVGLDLVRREMDRIGRDDEVIIVSATAAESNRLNEIFDDTKLARTGRLHFAQGRLPHGFRLRNENLLLLSGPEIFHRTEVRRTAQRHLGKAIDSFLDLREGDLIVHLAHGIGRYRGLQRLEKEGQIEDHLALEFKGGTKIYVPATKIDLVQKYVGGSKSRPQLAAIGGQTWLKHKQAAESAATDLAAEMLEISAERQARVGVSLSADTEWQQEFDALFPYQETADQLVAIAAIKKDLESRRPMDRLLCGDVGFGKTEVAMRAAFKAVDNGFQVAVLAPTTILCEQHYHTFQQRMGEFPFDIAKLSRFCTTAEEKENLEGIAAGRIDIAIGTHRIASKDVKFANLGLVIIDEEQRFGVQVKERLKALRASVDVLTLSATPIPRTLHMSLVGIRDISNLESPPEERIPVETRVTRFSNELVRHAIMRELNRGGQIYFVHNRVNDIQNVAAKLRELVPEADIRVGHGQMHETELEEVMVDFVAGKFDLLLATTIVESGLDIPNANTIFIDEADRYGLADLHQLRGRVGRYKHRAYCYLLIDQNKHITPNAARRLRAIEEYSEMGAGFAISMRDLEIRGAGNLLGTQQSGHIAAVGYELYCQLLENAVRKLRQDPPKLSLDVDIDLPAVAYFPDNYVPDIRSKIDLHRRLTRIHSDDALQQFHAELTDRFGKPPEPVERLLSLVELKIDAAIWLISAMRIEDGRYLRMQYANRGRMEQLARMQGKRVRIVDQSSAYVTLPAGNMTADEVISLAKSVLRPK